MSQRIPSIQCLLTFETLARTGNATQTARELCITPSAVSHRIRKLEQVIGFRLFDSVDFVLTAQGSEYLQHVRDGLGCLRRLPTFHATGYPRGLAAACSPC